MDTTIDLNFLAGEVIKDLEKLYRCQDTADGVEGIADGVSDKNGEEMHLIFLQEAIDTVKNVLSRY